MPVTVRFFAAAREAAGTSIAECESSSLQSLARELNARFGADLDRVLAISTWLVDGQQHRYGRDCDLPSGSVVDVLPPFAGG